MRNLPDRFPSTVATHASIASSELEKPAKSSSGIYGGQPSLAMDTTGHLLERVCISSVSKFDLHRTRRARDLVCGTRCRVHILLNTLVITSHDCTSNICSIS